VDTLLWVEDSAEYGAVTQSLYALARTQLDTALGDPSWTAALEQTGDYSKLPPAVILDVDETILSNAAYHVRLVKDGTKSKGKLRQAWFQEARCPAIPGALEFAKYAAGRGVTIFYVTNRPDAVRDGTRKNLEQLGFPFAKDREVLLMKAAPSARNKAPRRAAVAKDFRVLLLVGDSLGDFISGGRSVDNGQRVALAEGHSEHWGSRWIPLPNPIEGDWKAAAFGYDKSLRTQERRERKIQALDARRTPAALENSASP